MLINKEKNRLNKYSREIKRISKNVKQLNQKQKERMLLYITRILEYCRTQKVVKYHKNERVRDKGLIPTIGEKAVYRQLFATFNNLAVRVRNDAVLTESTKREFNKILKSVIGHLRGKQNVGNKYGKKIQIFGYVRTANVSSDINEQLDKVHRYVEENNLLLDAIYVDEELDELLQNRENTAFNELDRKVMNSNKKTVIIVKDISRISRDNKKLQQILTKWNSKNVQLIVLKK